MKRIYLPKTYNYIAVFLTFRCIYNCHYCITKFGKVSFEKEELDGSQWVSALNRLVIRDDVPVTLQGGEPSLHKDFIYIINHLEKRINIDILTNLSFDVDRFIKKVDPQRLTRQAPYACIRVSYHPEVMHLEELIEKNLKLHKSGFSIGVYGVLHPKQKKIILDAQTT